MYPVREPDAYSTESRRQTLNAFLEEPHVNVLPKKATAEVIPRSGTSRTAVRLPRNHTLRSVTGGDGWEIEHYGDSGATHIMAS